MEKKRGVSRRRFLKSVASGAGAAIALPVFVPGSALGADGAVAPSNRIVMASIGVGGMGSGNLHEFVGRDDVQVVAVCDVDADHRASAKQKVDERYGNSDCAAYNDFREITRRDDIDAVVVATPDHWHVLVALDAARHGKDLYVEKPLTLTIEEGRVLSDTVARFGRILQTGSQQRSGVEFRRACELVRNGRIGRVHTVRVGIPANSRTCPPAWSPEPVPPGFDYDFWLGQAPWEPYTTQRCHYSFRFLIDYSGGQVTNWGAHHLDIAQWGLGMDASGPIEVFGQGEFPNTGLFTTASRVYFECAYADGARVICETSDGRGGTRFEGADGWLHVDRGYLETFPKSLLHETLGANEIHLYESRNHCENFLDCIRSRQPAIANAEVGHRSATVCHLGNIAMLLGERLKWDPQAERFTNSEAANGMIGRTMRGPWRL